MNRSDATYKVARRLARKARPAAIYSSDLKRAAETVKIIAKVCDVSNVSSSSLPFPAFSSMSNTNNLFQLVLIEALRERHMGYLQGLTWDDAMNKSPGVFKGFANFEVKNGLDFDGRNHEFPVSSKPYFFFGTLITREM
jgi:probable phosphoglycerate mutase